MEDEEEERLIRRVREPERHPFVRSEKKKNGRARLVLDGNSPAILNVPSRLDIPADSHEHGVRNPPFFGHGSVSSRVTAERIDPV